MLQQLEAAKSAAVAAEDYDEARRCKELMDEARTSLKRAEQVCGGEQGPVDLPARYAARPPDQSASRSFRRALLTPQVNAGSLYRCGKRT